jgi:hypothetical protein
MADNHQTGGLLNMKSINFWGRIAVVAALLLLAVGGTAFAQLQTGNLFGTVTDDKGASLPGVTVTLTGQGAPQVQVTNAQGAFRFPNLSPASFDLKAELEGFSTIDYPNIVINIGRNTTIEVKLSPAVEDVITVTAESPLLDERRISTGNTVSKTELEKIPTARDPWAILQSTPGVLTDRINVGGNESGQQSTYVGPGSGGDQAIWAVDGVVITDMAALGSSPAYFDFDAFEEMQVTTGGSDSTIATGGVVLNMVTKRGTNEWRGSGRYYDADQKWQDGLDSSKVDLAPGQASFNQGNRIVTVKDYGAEIGGPIVKDRLWVWGSYGRQKVDLLTIQNVSDMTDLKTENVKLNGQIAPSNSITAFYFNNDKVKIGRNASPQRPQETTWDQGHFGDKPTADKIEDTQIFSSSFYLTGLYSRVNGGFELVPEGGLNTTAYQDQNGVWHNTFVLSQTDRPQTQYKLDASTFFNTGSLSNELKFGASHRTATVTSQSAWGGVGYVQNGGNFNLPTTLFITNLSRDGGASVKNKYDSAYAQDTVTIGNLTANVGVRYDKQGGDNLARSEPGNPLLNGPGGGGNLPAVSVSEGDIGFSWTNITPRLGLTYALGADRKTLLRASFSQFADQLGTGTSSILNPLGTQSYAYFYAYNPVGGPSVTPGQIGGFGVYSANVNPFTGGLLQSNGLSSNLSAPKTDELLLGVEHALLPEFVVALDLTYRKLTNLLETDRLVFDSPDAYSATNVNSIGRRSVRSDYIQCGTAGAPKCPIVNVPGQGTRTLTDYYVLRPGVSSRNGFYTYNGGREQEYKGASIVFTKRLANRWMLRGNVTYADWTWSKVPDADRQDPTSFLNGGNKEGDPVLQGSGTASGAFGNVYINSKWAYSLNALYQIAPDHKWGFNAAINVTGRQGYPDPYFLAVRNPSNEAGTTFIQATDSPDSFRLQNINIVDARLEKEFAFSDFGLTIGVDCFNVFNEAYVQQRQLSLSGQADYVREVTSPRIFRLGARISFR